MKQKVTFSFFSKFLSLVLVISLFSCEKDELDFSEPLAEEVQATETMENFRRKIENPYTIANMQMALDSIRYRMEGGKVKTAANEKAAIPNKKKIKPNVLYIQFNPKTYEQEGLLKKDSTLALIDYPLGYEYEDAWFKHRPKLNKDEIPSYFTSVHVDRELPEGVPHKILAEMYLPQQDENLDTKRASLYKTSKNEIGDFVDILLNQAFKQTNNEGLDGLGILKSEKEESQSQSKFLGIGIGEKWHPEGTLRIWDDHIGTTTTTRRILVGYETYDCSGGGLQPIEPNTIEYGIIQDTECERPIFRYEPVENQGSYVALEGAQVLLRDTFTIGNEITNSEGYFSFDELRGEKRYIIQWERYEYSIRNGSLFQAEYHGPKKHSRWDHDIKGGDTEYHGMIHLAAYDYYYGSRFGLISPTQNNSLFNQMKIAARESAPWEIPASYSHIRSELTFGLAPQIHIKAWNKSSELIYGATIHELAHSSHYNLSPNSYNDIVQDGFFSGNSATKNNNRRLLETWARTVETVFVLERYRDDAGNPDYEYLLNNFQRQTIADDNHYTSAGLDLMDDINQNIIYPFGGIRPIDNVDGFNINQLEDALDGAKSWHQWRDNLKNIIPGMSNELDELFANWQD